MRSAISVLLNELQLVKVNVKDAVNAVGHAENELKRYQKIEIEIRQGLDLLEKYVRENNLSQP